MDFATLVRAATLTATLGGEPCKASRPRFSSPDLGQISIWYLAIVSRPKGPDPALPAPRRFEDVDRKFATNDRKPTTLK